MCIRNRQKRGSCSVLNEQQQGRHASRNQQPRHHRKPTSQRNRLLVNFSVPGVIDQTSPQAPTSPQRQGQRRRETSADNRRQICIGRKRHAKEE